jgi:hypothetical protein
MTSSLTSSAVIGFAALWHDSKLRNFVHRLAVRHGGSLEDIEDMEGEAWARVSQLSAQSGVEACKKAASQGIWTEYQRNRRRGIREESVNSNSESREIGHGRMKGKYAGMRQLSTACRGLHGTLCTAILTFEVACAMEQDNVLWLAGEEYESLRQAAEAEEKDGIRNEE